MNAKYLLRIFQGSLDTIVEMMENVPDDRMAEQFTACPNHAAWTLTHLCVASDLALQCCNKPTMCPEDWAFARPGSTPVAERDKYPAKATLLKTLRQQHEAVAAALPALPADHFQSPSPEALRHFAPETGDILTYLLATHENYHLAQLIDWKRAAGL